MSRKNALVTGCAGFIGSHLAERLIAEGFAVVGIDNFSAYYPRADKEANLDALRNEANFTLLEADLASAPLDAVLADRPAIFHLAAQAGVRSSFGEGFAQYAHDNLIATQRVFEAAQGAGCERVVWASSSSVYGNAADYPCPETAPTAPRSPYGVTKRACEDLADIYRGRGLATVGLRYFTVYGPRQRPDMAMRRICEALLSGEAFPMFGDGAQSRDFTFVADAVEATYRSAFASDPESIYNVGGGQEASLSRVVSILEDLAGATLNVDRQAAQRGDVIRTGADTSRARRSLDWAPTTEIEEGLAAELAWVTERRRSLSDPLVTSATQNS
jgi:nucleoside-diphosphate-sugar epimerase